MIDPTSDDKVEPMCRRFRLLRCERGQIMLYTLAAAFTMFLAVALIYNTGNRLTEKARAQAAADAGAYTYALWYARGMNMVSSNNVGMSEALAWICIIKSLDQTVTICVAIADGLRIAGGLTSLWGGGALSLLAEIAYEYLQGVVKPIVDALRDLAKEPDGKLWLFIDALSEMSEAAKSSCMAIGAIEAKRVCKANGADEDSCAFYVPKEELPLQRVRFGELYHPTLEGTADDDRLGFSRLLRNPNYPENRGPLPTLREPFYWGLMPALVTGAPFIFESLTLSHLDELTRDEFTARERPKPVEYKRDMMDPDDTDGGLADSVEARWRHSYQKFENGLLVEPPLDEVIVVPRAGKPPGVGGSGWTYSVLTDQHAGERHTVPAVPTSGFLKNEIRKRMKVDAGQSARNAPTTETTWYQSPALGPRAFDRPPLRTFVWERIELLESGEPPREIRIVERYKFEGGRLHTRAPSANVAVAGRRPPIWLLDQDEPLSRRRGVLTLVGVTGRTEIGAAFFRKGLNGLSVAYAQADVFNGWHEDMFTQDWHARLAEASLLHEALDPVGTFARNPASAIEVFDLLKKCPALQRAGASQLLGAEELLDDINLH